jgi:hypothetical protein
MLLEQVSRENTMSFGFKNKQAPRQNNFVYASASGVSSTYDTREPDLKQPTWDRQRSPNFDRPPFTKEADSESELIQ